MPVEGMPNGLGDDGVRLLDVEAEVDRLVLRDRHPVVADAVADEAGRVLADNDAFAQRAGRRNRGWLP